MLNTKSFLVTGARGVIGVPLIDRLIARHAQVIAVSRSNQNSSSEEVRWIKADLAKEPAMSRYKVDILVHCAPLWLLPAVLENNNNQNMRVLAFSSTSVISKKLAPDQSDSELAFKLSCAEQSCQIIASKLGIQLLILRPTMIYGYGLDQNVMQIASIIKKFYVFPLAGKAAGMRQPVHSSDLVDLIIKISNRSEWVDGIIEVGGAEILSYRQMVIRIYRALNRRPRLVSIPTRLYRLLIKTFSYLMPALSPGMADRMNQDLVYNHDKAIKELGFKPSKFLQHPAQDLVFDTGRHS